MTSILCWDYDGWKKNVWLDFGVKIYYYNVWFSKDKTVFNYCNIYPIVIKPK